MYAWMIVYVFVCVFIVLWLQSTFIGIDHTCSMYLQSHGWILSDYMWVFYIMLFNVYKNLPLLQKLSW